MKGVKLRLTPDHLGSCLQRHKHLLTPLPSPRSSHAPPPSAPPWGQITAPSYVRFLPSRKAGSVLPQRQALSQLGLPGLQSRWPVVPWAGGQACLQAALLRRPKQLSVARVLMSFITQATWCWGFFFHRFCCLALQGFPQDFTIIMFLVRLMMSPLRDINIRINCS